ncbi:MAG: bifunctional phosphoribosyl-AMP cyclohydrolase/phosphoribosyl-ATP diphosphatase HisIE [Pyrinomonadaceae bacterium]|nr:bifunctional phosphoribosyl-AMP cyclohydrolase/phosphoribosyl-ATP diphosphatase HisIE [Pyrinomonadaceae bacterium]MDQ3585296.1 bifunctional phosphoribosyl-AMP cyclohydrolase/phosphoribosyl-ATP diphosphatase HisIE [Acidobacteriota bacterium]
MKVRVENIKFDERGLVPVVVQDARTRKVLTLAYMNEESLRRTLSTGETWFWSRSRARLWHKGETSGHTQRVSHVRVDCDGDALVILVEPAGPACHTNEFSCFHNELEGAVQKDQKDQAAAESPELGQALQELHSIVESRRRERPAGSYTTYLFDQGLDKILKKIGEESTETIIAAKNEDTGALVSETADLLYHLVVLLVERGISLDDVERELTRRRGAGGGNES